MKGSLWVWGLGVCMACGEVPEDAPLSVESSQTPSAAPSEPADAPVAVPLPKQPVSIDVGPPDQEVRISGAILPHCIHGIDPHAVKVVVAATHELVPKALNVSPEGFHALRFAGLANGDRVQTVNGYPLGTLDRLVAAREGTRGMTTCTWQVVTRHGDPWTVRVKIDPVPLDAAPPRVLEDGSIAISRAWLVGQLASPYLGYKPWVLRNGDELLLLDPLYREAFESLGVTSTFRSGRKASLSLTKIVGFGTPASDLEREFQEWHERILTADGFTLNLRHPTDGESTTTVVLEGPPITWPKRPALVEDKSLPPVLTLDQWQEQFATIRHRPHRDLAGKVDGLRLSAIRRKNPLSRLGVKNGDVLTSINGRPVVAEMSVNAESVLRRVLAADPKATTLVLALIRRGSPMTVSIPVGS